MGFQDSIDGVEYDDSGEVIFIRGKGKASDFKHISRSTEDMG